jgi:Flp pilus assembly protein CpaB
VATGSSRAAPVLKEAIMEIEYHDDRRRAKFVVVIGVVLALVAGGAAFVVMNQAQQQASHAGQTLTRAVVAVAAIPARKEIKASDVAVQDVALDPANANGITTDITQVVGHIPAVTILQGQIVTTNMLASTAQGGEFSILRPDETIAPDSEAWRAVSVTVPDDLAVGGMLSAGENVDVFVTTVVTIPQDLLTSGKYVSDRSTKITYQDILILARKDAFYVIRVALPVAEEISHLQAVGATFSFALRPDADTRPVDTTNLGETTNRIISKYGLPFPEPPTTPGSQPSTTSVAAPTPTPTPAPSPTPVPSPTP